MKTVPSGLATHLTQGVTTLATCWRVVRTDGQLILGTEHDKDIVIASGDLAGTYEAQAGITGSAIVSSSDLSVDNLEVTGSLVTINSLSAADIESGQFDDADVTLFVINWADPSGGALVLRYGNLGNISRTAEGKYTTELRGLSQRLTPPIIEVYTDTCRADLGDARCGKDISWMILDATVTAVTSRRRFVVSLVGVDTGTSTGGGSVTGTFSDTSATQGDYALGKLVGLTGANAGYTREVRRDAVGGLFGDIELYEPLAVMPEVGDTFSLYPGCNKELATCRDRFDNVLRFRGYGVYTPGINKMLRGPDRGSGPT